MLKILSAAVLVMATLPALALAQSDRKCHAAGVFVMDVLIARDEGRPLEVAQAFFRFPDEKRAIATIYKMKSDPQTAGRLVRDECMRQTRPVVRK